MFRNLYFSACIAIANTLAIAAGIDLTWSMRCHSEEFIAKWTRTWLYVVLPLGAAFACLLSALIAHRFGRRMSLLFMGVIPLTASTLVHTFATCHIPPAWQLVARSLASLAVGTASTQVPVYVRELCAAANRGSDTLLHSPRVFIALGHCLSYTLAAISSSSASIVVALHITAIAATIGMTVLFICYLPETPQFLIASKQELRAKDVLIRLKNSTLIDTDFRLLCERNSRVDHIIRHRASADWRALARTVIFGAVLAQTSSVPVFCFFASDVFVYFRVIQQQKQLLGGGIQLTIIGLVQLVVTEVVVRFVDKFSRRTLVLGTLSILLIGVQLPLTYFFHSMSEDGSIVMHLNHPPTPTTFVQLSIFNMHSTLALWTPIICVSTAFVGHHLIRCAIDLIAADIDLEDRRLHQWTLAGGECLSLLLCCCCALVMFGLESDFGMYTREWIYAGQNCLWLWFLFCAISTLISILLVKFGFINCKLLMPQATS